MIMRLKNTIWKGKTVLGAGPGKRVSFDTRYRPQNVSCIIMSHYETLDEVVIPV